MDSTFPPNVKRLPRRRTAKQSLVVWRDHLRRSVRMKHPLLILLFTIATTSIVCADEPPVIPIGLDAYRQWQQWPLQRIGLRTYMRSTYDRRGGNEGADASQF